MRRPMRNIEREREAITERQTTMLLMCSVPNWVPRMCADSLEFVGKARRQHTQYPVYTMWLTHFNLILCLVQP